MDRKAFIKTCGWACLSGTAMTSVLQSCGSLNIIHGSIVGDDLVVPVSEFIIRKKDQISFKKYVVVEHELLAFPICIYRFDENEYSALWMRCTHQGTELQVFGDKMQCPAHGSEFDTRGGVQNGPAERRLRSFPVMIEADQLKISLKAIG